MATPKEEKLLASIDGTLKDILKELKRQGKTEILTEKGKLEIEASNIIDRIKREGAIQGFGR